MVPYDLDPILDKIEHIVDTHRIAPGEFARYLPEVCGVPDTFRVNAYGCADAANILYTLNRFPEDPAVRAAHVSVLQNQQDPVTGLFEEQVAGWKLAVIHTTAHCTAALDLFDARPLYPFHALEQYLDPEQLGTLLSEFNAHKGAGIYAAMSVARCVPESWKDAYFTWMNDHCDPETGLIRDPRQIGIRPVSTCMGDTFHYLFNYRNARRSFPYPDKLIDTCLDLYCNGGDLPDNFGKTFTYIEMDWVYCLNRSLNETPHRFHEVKEVLWDFAQKYLDFMEHADWDHDTHANDLHLMFGATCCLAELQLALPGMLHSSRTLRPVLDRRPFI